MFLAYFDICASIALVSFVILCVSLYSRFYKKTLLWEVGMGFHRLPDWSMASDLSLYHLTQNSSLNHLEETDVCFVGSCVCVCLYTCMHRCVYVPHPAVNYQYNFRNTFFHVKLWSFVPAIKPGYQVSLKTSYLSDTSLPHTTVKSPGAVSSHRWLAGSMGSLFLHLTPSPVILHSPRTTLSWHGLPSWTFSSFLICYSQKVWASF